ncbi:MAG: PH domain-containing protein [Mycobacterium sp.]
MLAISAVTLVTEAPGRLLVGLAGVGLIGFAGVSWRARPKLALTPGGLLVRGWLQPQMLTPADLKTVRITDFRRFGRRVRLLELETHDDRLLVLSRWDLGVDPIDVLDALTAAGYTGR